MKRLLECWLIQNRVTCNEKTNMEDCGASSYNQYLEACGCGSLISLLWWAVDALGTPPLASLCARNLACSAPSSARTAAPPRSGNMQYSFIFLYENLQRFPVPIPNTQWPEADALMSPWQKPQNYPDGCIMGKAHSSNLRKSLQQG